MDPRVFLKVFSTVFVAELGDKTQLATMLFAADRQVGRWTVFAAASLALVATSALGVLAGGVLTRFVSERTLGVVAGLAFLVIGAFTLWKALSHPA
jgi:putative Ca2+/H+ antiporter (TMEM165/GDT1 family)